MNFLHKFFNRHGYTIISTKLVVMMVLLIATVNVAHANETTSLQSSNDSAELFSKNYFEEDAKQADTDDKHWQAGLALLKTSKFDLAKKEFELGRAHNSIEYPFMQAHVDSLQGHNVEAIRKFKAILPDYSSSQQEQINAYYNQDAAMRQAVLEENIWLLIMSSSILYLMIFVFGLSIFFILKDKAWAHLCIIVGLISSLFTQAQSEDAVTLAHLVCSTIAAIISFRLWKRGKQVWSFPFGALALLFNPVLHVKLESDTWNYLYFLVCAFVVLSIPLTSDKRHKLLDPLRANAGLLVGTAVSLIAIACLSGWRASTQFYETPKPKLEQKEDKTATEKIEAESKKFQQQVEARQKLERSLRTKKYGRFAGSFNGFEVYNPKLRFEYACAHVFGTVVNDTELPVDYVEIKIDLLDSAGRIIGSEYTNLASHLQPNEAWKFQVSSYEGSKVQSFRIQNVDSHTF